MARMTMLGIDDYMKQISSLGVASGDILKKAVEKGAEPIEDAIRKGIEDAMSDSDISKGELLESIGTAPVDVDYQGNTNTKIGFQGYDRNSKPTPKYPRGTPNALKMRALESGTYKQKKKPIIRPAVRRAKKKAEDEIRQVFDTELKKYF